MAGIFSDSFGVAGGSGNGVLPFGSPPVGPNPFDANRHAILGYLAGALQGGNLGQSIGRGLQGWLTGGQTDATEQGQRVAAHYVARQPDIDPAIRSVLMQSPALAMRYLQAKMSPHVTRDIAEYEYAKKQGFKGTLPDFIQSKRASVASAQE